MKQQRDTISYNQLMQAYSEMEVELEEEQRKRSKLEYDVKAITYQRDLALEEKRMIKNKLNDKKMISSALRQREEISEELGNAVMYLCKITEFALEPDMLYLYKMLKHIIDNFIYKSAAMPRLDEMPTSLDVFQDNFGDDQIPF